MEYVRLGKTNLLASRIAIGAMSLKNNQNAQTSSLLIRSAYEEGINFFDATHNINSSEKILGNAIYEVRKNVIISTKTKIASPNKLIVDLEESLSYLNCDFIDLYQYEFSNFVYNEEVFKTIKKLKSSGKIKHVGAVTEDFDCAIKIIESNLFETLQFPFSMISSTRVHSLIDFCTENDMGFIAMRPLCGGVISNIPLAFGFLQQYENVFPVWGVDTLEQLNQILYFNSHPPIIDESFQKDVENARKFFN